MKHEVCLNDKYYRISIYPEVHNQGVSLYCKKLYVHKINPKSVRLYDSPITNFIGQVTTPDDVTSMRLCYLGARRSYAKPDVTKALLDFKRRTCLRIGFLEKELSDCKKAIAFVDERFDIIVSDFENNINFVNSKTPFKFVDGLKLTPKGN